MTMKTWKARQPRLVRIVQPGPAMRATAADAHGLAAIGAVTAFARPAQTAGFPALPAPCTP
jgi:hypothetical protein